MIQLLARCALSLIAGAVVGFCVGITATVGLVVSALLEEPGGANDIGSAAVMMGAFIIVPVCTIGGAVIGLYICLILAVYKNYSP